MEEAFMYSKHLQIHESLVVTSTPNKIGLALRQKVDFCVLMSVKYLTMIQPKSNGSFFFSHPVFLSSHPRPFLLCILFFSLSAFHHCIPILKLSCIDFFL